MVSSEGSVDSPIFSRADRVALPFTTSAQDTFLVPGALGTEPASAGHSPTMTHPRHRHETTTMLLLQLVVWTFYNMSLSNRYYRRLQLNPATLDAEPTLKKLQRITEAHLRTIPFENLAQHGAVGGPATLDMEKTANKILDQYRGGFCFELNGLAAAFLEELGYTVTRVPSIVYKENFDGIATHMILIVKAVDKVLYFADVGFGEPALYPLRYEQFDIVQKTPEGMQSKLVRDGDDVILYWHKCGGWMPRLKWNYKESMLGADGPNVPAFAEALAVIHDESSIFSQKLVATMLTRNEKLTLAGNRLKSTSKRYPDNEAAVSVRKLDGEQEARDVLSDRFGIPLAETKGLDLSKSLAAKPEVWAHM